MQTCIMSSLPRCIFRCSVFRYVTLVSFFFLFFVQTLLFNCNSFTLVANKYLLTYLLTVLTTPNDVLIGKPTMVNAVPIVDTPLITPTVLAPVDACSNLL